MPLARFRAATQAVVSQLRILRALHAEANALAEAGEVDALAALLRRAASLAPLIFDEAAAAAACEGLSVCEAGGNRPAFHVMGAAGWVNDPNGLIYYGGKYHAFFQHHPDKPHWDWGLVWGHVVSDDLVTWRRLPPAIAPTRGAADSLACFSGCAFATPDGGVTLLYTGVTARRRKTANGALCALMSPGSIPAECFLPPPSLDLNAPRRLPSRASQPGTGGCSTPLGAGDEKEEAPGSAGRGLVGCAAELYAAVAAINAERSAGELSSLDLSRGADSRVSSDGEEEVYGTPYGSPSILSPDSPMPRGIGGAAGTLRRAATSAAISAAASPRPARYSADGGSRSPRRLSIGDGWPITPRAAHSDAFAAGGVSAAEESEWLEGLAQQPFVEAVCGARAAAADETLHAHQPHPDLTAFSKLGSPVIAAPPAELVADLLGWRDPYVFRDVARSGGEGGSDAVWRMLLGVGLKHKGGAALVYTSRSVDGTTGWAYSGLLCCAADLPLPTCAVGSMWECPLLIPLSPPSPSGAVSHALFVVSPDRPTNRVLYWIGRYSASRFDLATASGPHALDAGDIAYAPNVLHAGNGRPLLFAWLQERDAARVAARGVAAPAVLPADARGPVFGGITYASIAEAAAALETAAAEGYSGCLSVPRVLSLSDDGRRLCQEPVAELRRLRTVPLSPAVGIKRGTPLLPDTPLALVRGGCQCDVELLLRRGAAAAVGVWRPALRPPATGLLLLYWFGCDAGLSANHEASLEAAMAAAVRDRTASQLTDEGTPFCTTRSDPAELVQLRLLVDRSVVELFTSERTTERPGLALATRHYSAHGDGTPLKRAPPALAAVALGGTAAVLSAGAWAMRSAWEEGTT